MPTDAMQRALRAWALESYGPNCLPSQEVFGSNAFRAGWDAAMAEALVHRGPRRVCSACRQAIRLHHKWSIGADGRVAHRRCDAPEDY